MFVNIVFVREKKQKEGDLYERNTNAFDK